MFPTPPLPSGGLGFYFTAVGGWHLGDAGKSEGGKRFLSLTRPQTDEGETLFGPARRSAKGFHCISSSN